MRKIKNFNAKDKTLMELYDEVATQLGYEPALVKNYDCRKIYISQNIQDELFKTYENKDYTKSHINQMFLGYAPKVDKELKENEITVYKGFIVEKTKEINTLPLLSKGQKGVEIAIDMNKLNENGVIFMDPKLKMEKEKMETEGLKGYEKYQLEWMIEHNYSLDDLIGNLQTVWKELHEEREEGAFVDVTTTYEVWHDSFGFDNELFVSESEWHSNEEKEEIEEEREEVELDI